MLNCSASVTDRTQGCGLVRVIEIIIKLYDHLGPDHASVIENREVSLIRRSSKYTFLCLVVDQCPYNGGVLDSEGRNREVPLYIGVRGD